VSNRPSADASSRILTPVLLLANAALLALIAAIAMTDVERWAIGSETANLPPAAAAASTSPTVVQLPPTPQAADFLDTLARPLFRAGRRPAPPPVVEAPVKPAPPVIAKPVADEPLPDLQLLGVMTLPNGTARALLRTRSDPKGVWMSPGETIDGWRLGRVGKDRVVLELGSRRHEVGLRNPGRDRESGARRS